MYIIIIVADFYINLGKLFYRGNSTDVWTLWQVEITKSLEYTMLKKTSQE